MLKKLEKWHLIGILTLTIGVYCFSLFNDFVYDDTSAVKNNLLITDWSNLPELFSKTYFSRSSEESYRPIVTLTYFVDYFLWRLNPSGYHLTNILIHSVNVVLLYLLFLSLSLDRGIAFFSAVFFAVHPVQAEAVNAISFREDLLVVFFLFPAFLLFLRISKLPGIDKVKRLTLYLISIVFYQLALLSKEMAVTFPLFLIGYYFCFADIKQRQERNLFIYLFSGYVLVTIGYLFLYFGPFSNPNPSTILAPSFFIRLLIIPKVLVHYLWLILIPYELNADHVIKFSSSLSEFSVWFPMLLLLGIGVVSFMLFKRYRKEMFGLWWFFAGLLPVMNIVPIFNVMAERYLYLPFAGLSLFFSTSLIYLYRWKVSNLKFQLVRMAFVAVVGLLVVVLASRTVLRNLDWKDNFTLWSKTVITSPGSDRAHNNLGIAYSERGLLDEAMAEYRKAIKINPNFANAHNNLGVAYYERGFLDEAMAEYRKALAINHKNVDAYNNLGTVYYERGLLDEAMAEYRKALEINPNHIDAHNNLGAAYDKRGLLDEAMAEYRKVLNINPNFANAHNNLGAAYDKRGLLDEAMAEYRKALEINPNYLDAHNNLGALYAMRGMLDEAITEFREVLKIDVEHTNAHNSLGVAYYKKGMLDKAAAEYQKAIRINPNFANAHNNLGNVYAKRGHLDKAIAEFEEAVRIKPDYAHFHNDLGRVYEKKGFLDKAILEYREAVRIKHDDALYHYNIGTIYQRKGLIDLAIAEYKEAVRIDPDMDIVHNNLGAIFTTKGLLDQAIDEYKKALRISPYSAVIHYNLGYVYQKKGFMEKSIVEFKKALAINPDLKLAKENLERAMHLGKSR